MNQDDAQASAVTITFHGNPAYEPCPMPDGLSVQLDELEQLESGTNPDWAEIADRYRLLMMRYPDYFPLQYDLAGALLENGRTAEAEEILRPLVKAHPQYLLARGTLLALYAEAERIEEGNILLESTVYPAEEQPMAYLHWALSVCAFYFRIPNIPEAENWLEMAKKIAPDHSAVLEYEEMLAAGKMFLKLLDAEEHRKNRTPRKKKTRLRK